MDTKEQEQPTQLLEEAKPQFMFVKPHEVCALAKNRLHVVGHTLHYLADDQGRLAFAVYERPGVAEVLPVCNPSRNILRKLVLEGNMPCKNPKILTYGKGALKVPAANDPAWQIAWRLWQANSATGVKDVVV